MAFAPALVAPPDEQTQDAALVANVVDPVAVGASQVLPPPPLPAPAANLPLDALMAGASAPPPAVPLTPVDTALATALPPDGGPALSALPPPPATPPPATPVEAAKRNVDELAKLDKEQETINAEKTRLETEQATAKAEHEKQKAEALGKLQARQEFHRTQAADAVAAARSEAESKPYHTFWESRSIGQNLSTAVGLILGGVSWNANHVNRGVQLLQHMMDQDLALQKAQHEDLWRAVEAAERGERALDHRELRETAAFSAAQGAKWDAIAGRLGAMIAANKGKGDTATAKRVMIEANEKAVTAWQNAESAAAAAAHLKELEREAQERNRIMEIRALKYKTKGGGTGGGGGSSQAVIELKGKIAELQKSGLKGVELSQAVDREAVRLKIPLVGKANTVNARSIMADVNSTDAKAATADARELKLTEADEARVVRDTKGNPIGMAPKANLVAKIANDLAAQEKYMKLIDELAEHVEKHGTIIDDPEHPRREEAKKRMSIFAEVQALGRVLAQLQATDAGTKLEHQMIGNSGVSLNPFPSMLSPAVLRELGHKNAEQVQGRLKSQLTPMPARMKQEGGGPPVGSKPGRLSDGRAAWLYPDGTKHLADGTPVDTL